MLLWTVNCQMGIVQMKILRTILLITVLFSLCILTSGCSHYKEMRMMSQQMRDDQLEFYEYLANSYYLLGYEYYNLAEELKAQKYPVRSQQMAKRAKLYYEQSEDLNSSAESLRRRFSSSSSSDAKTEKSPQPAKDFSEIDIKPLDIDLN